jgi:hypothetical protein
MTALKVSSLSWSGIGSISSLLLSLSTSFLHVLKGDTTSTDLNLQYLRAILLLLGSPDRGKSIGSNYIL